MRFFRVKNFEQFQHYKDRAPPWIKLYNELLDDYDFGLLQDASKFHLIAIWLLASRSENKIPLDAGWVSRRINATGDVDLDELVNRGFLIVDQELQGSERSASTTLASCPSEREGQEQKIDRIGSAGASLFTEGSNALADTFLQALGFDTPLKVPPEFAGVHWRAVTWEAAGWTTDLIAAEARKIGPEKPLTYHEKCFATAFAKRQAPLPIVQIREAETLKVTHGTSKPGSLIAAIDRQLAAIEAEAGNDFALSESPVRRISG